MRTVVGTSGMIVEASPDDEHGGDGRDERDERADEEDLVPHAPDNATGRAAVTSSRRTKPLAFRA
jgi:hypothetical protein